MGKCIVCKASLSLENKIESMEILIEETLCFKDEVIDLNSYASGVYFLRINGTDGTQQVEKLIKY